MSTDKTNTTEKQPDVETLRQQRVFEESQADISESPARPVKKSEATDTREPITGSAPQQGERELDDVMRSAAEGDGEPAHESKLVNPVLEQEERKQRSQGHRPDQQSSLAARKAARPLAQESAEPKDNKDKH